MVDSITLKLPSPRTPASRDAGAWPARAAHWVLFFLAVVPAALIVRLIGQYGVNVPFGDEWSLVPLFARWNDHQMTFTDLFRQHNEHRIFFPKLIHIAFAQLTHWNLRAEMFFSVFLCAITSACIYGLLKRTIGGGTGRRIALLALFNLFIFSPSQSENWLWGFQIAMFMPTTCLVAALLVLHSPSIQALRFVSACVLAVVATFSFGNGLLLWPVIGAYLLLRGANKRWIICWTGTFMVVAIIHFVGYESHPSPGQHHGSPLDYVIYFLRFNGNALGQLPVPSHLVWTAVIGAGAALLYAASIAAFLRWRSSSLRAAAPWIAVAAYALGSALLTAYARVREGIEQALNSRYSSISVNLYIALVALVVIASDHINQAPGSGRSSRIAVSFTRAFMAMLVAWYVLTLPEGVGTMEDMYQLRTHGLANLSFCKVIPPTETLRRALRIHDELSAFLQNIADLERLNLLSPPLHRTNLLDDGAGTSDRSTEEFGRCEGAVWHSPTAFEIGGWACLPLFDEPAPCVVLAYESSGKWHGFALAEVYAERPDVAKKLDDGQRWSGWRRMIDTSTLPKDAHRISAWAVDAQTADVFRLPGAITLPSD